MPHPKLIEFLVQNRLMAMFPLSQLRDEAKYIASLEAGRLVASESHGVVRFLAYLSPTNTLHLLGDFGDEMTAPLANMIKNGPPRAICGPRLTVDQLLAVFSDRLSVIQRYDDTVYTLPLPSPTQIPTQLSRLLTEDDFEAWHRLYVEYLTELNLVQNTSKAARLERFQIETQLQWHWGTFDHNGHLQSIIAFNAVVDNIAQLGGAYTSPHLRQKGIAQLTLAKLIIDAMNIHRLKALSLATGNSSTPSGYGSIKAGFRPVGEYTLCKL